MSGHTSVVTVLTDEVKIASLCCEVTQTNEVRSTLLGTTFLAVQDRQTGLTGEVLPRGLNSASPPPLGVSPPSRQHLDHQTSMKPPLSLEKPGKWLLGKGTDFLEGAWALFWFLGD